MKKNKTRKIILWVVVTLLVLFGVYTIGGSMYLINFALLPKEKATKSYRTAYQRTFSKYTYMKGWVDSLNSCKALRDTTITNKEGLRLHGYYIKAAANSHTERDIHHRHPFI